MKYNTTETTTDQQRCRGRNREKRLEKGRQYYKERLKNSL